MRAHINWSEDKTALIRTSSYFTGDSPNVDYTSKETWRLSSDGKTLTLSRDLSVNGRTLAIRAVYDRQ